MHVGDDGIGECIALRVVAGIVQPERRDPACDAAALGKLMDGRRSIRNVESK